MAENDMNENGTIGTTRALKLDQAMLTRLHGVPILSSLTDEQLVCLERAEEMTFHAGEYVIRQGEVERHFWILLDGELRLSQRTLEGHEMHLYVMPRGTAFGETSLLANIPNTGSFRAIAEARLLRLDEDGFWKLMTVCPMVRKAVLGNMALRYQKMQNIAVHQEKMASLGTLAAGLMHELNNPGAAARRAASQLRDNLMRLHELGARFTKTTMTSEQKVCILDLQQHALSRKEPLQMNSLEQSDAEERLTEWLQEAEVEHPWKVAPTLVSIGIDAAELECARQQFPATIFSDALSWMEAMVSSMQLVNTIEESIGRVGDLVQAVKSYAYEGKGQKQTLDVNASVHATLVILGHKFREKQITVEKEFGEGLPLLQTMQTGLNQVWTNLLDNAIDAVAVKGRIRIKTWVEAGVEGGGGSICVSVADNGTGIPAECQKQVFDPFFTTKQAGVGTGLGLGIVHRIVEQFGGRILFSSEPGRTEFLVRLPSGAA